MTIQDLARLANIGYDNLYKIEKGLIENPRGDTIAKLSHALGVDEQFLRFGFHKVDNHSSFDSSKFLAGLEESTREVDLGLIDRAWRQALEVEEQVYGVGNKGPIDFVSTMFARIYQEMLKRSE
ncbi:hypothetical protein GCM10007094_22950 [Pseudovibrio japonicus]|uniref:HTH cro/C1-type domain-containing protein n=2 Tax=Pseudovibrio japonicus TaxID=366534 RepID=A0ABQ3EFW9_9HYPH|nr:hypothetical protein GCM10007094_22950 [Pseudovibrio japonicus]